MIKTPRPSVWSPPKTPRPTKGEKTPRPTKEEKTPKPTMDRTPKPTFIKTPRPSVWSPPKTPRPTKEEKTPRPTSTYLQETPRPTAPWNKHVEVDELDFELDADYSPVMSECPAEGHSGLDCSFEKQCKYGETTCCGKTTASTICWCEDNGKTTCVISDRCMFPICDQPTEGEQCGDNMCEKGEYCCNESCGICAPKGGHCTQQFCIDETPQPTESDAGNSGWGSPKTPKPTSPPRTPKPTTWEAPKTPRPTPNKTPRPTKEEKTPKPSRAEKTPRPSI